MLLGQSSAAPFVSAHYNLHGKLQASARARPSSAGPSDSLPSPHRCACSSPERTELQPSTQRTVSPQHGGNMLPQRHGWRSAAVH